MVAGQISALVEGQSNKGRHWGRLNNFRGRICFSWYHVTCQCKPMLYNPHGKTVIN